MSPQGRPKGELAPKRAARRELESMTTAAEGLAKHLSLLFVPAGTGVMLHVTQIEAEWVPIVAAIVASTVLAMVTTALTFQWLIRRQERR